MSIFWHEAAVLELEDAALYYGGVDDELGQRFIAAIEVVMIEIKARPEMRRKFDGEVRKTRLKSFPYAMLYYVEGSNLRILAVMHLHREPGYWHGRVGK